MDAAEAELNCADASLFRYNGGGLDNSRVLGKRGLRVDNLFVFLGDAEENPHNDPRPEEEGDEAVQGVVDRVLVNDDGGAKLLLGSHANGLNGGLRKIKAKEFF